MEHNIKVILLGATGYLGSHTAEQLIKSGHDVTCLVRHGSNQTFLQQLHATVIADESSWTPLIDQTTTVINCIADTRSHASYEQHKVVEINRLAFQTASKTLGPTFYSVKYCHGVWL